MGVTLTCVPGTQCDQRVWEPVWRVLPPEITPAYIAIETQTTRAGMLAMFADAAAAHGPLHIAAFSMGGYLSLAFALEQPGSVASLSLVCSSAFGLTNAEAAERVKIIKFLETHPYRGMSVSRMRQFVHPSHWADPAVIEVIRAMDLDLGHDVLLAQMRETSTRRSLEGRLQDIACPTLLVGADSDPFVAWSSIERMRDLIPNAEAGLAINAGHMIPLEQPDWLAARLGAFQAERV
jgi:pimeloyl-ACP methyl ester carboxylesterase